MPQREHISNASPRRLLVAVSASFLLIGLIAWGALSRPAAPAGDVADEPPRGSEGELDRRAEAAAAELRESLSTSAPLAPLNPPTAPTTSSGRGAHFEAPFGSPDNAYVALIGGPSGTIALDLVTGEMRVLPAGLDVPVVVVDDFVVWRRESTGLLRFSPLDDLGDVQRLHGATLATEVAVGARPNTVVWVDGFGGTSVTVKAASLETNEVVAETELNGWIGWVRLAEQAEFVSPASGGVYRWSPAGFQQVLADGAVAAQGQGLLMVVKCDELLRCRHQWYDTADMQVRDLATPPQGSSLLSGQVLAGGWISISSPDNRNGRSDLLEVRSGQLVSDVGRFGALHPVDITHDGAVAVGALGGDVQLIDLMTGDRALVELPASLGMTELQSVFVVPKIALGRSLEQFRLLEPAD